MKENKKNHELLPVSQLEQIANMKESPDQRAWLKIERKLDRRIYKNRISIYRNIALAALMLLLVCFTLIFSLGLDGTSGIINNTAASVSSSFSIQDLKADSDPLYSSLKIKELNNSYLKSLGQFNFENSEPKQIL